MRYIRLGQGSWSSEVNRHWKSSLSHPLAGKPTDRVEEVATTEWLCRQRPNSIRKRHLITLDDVLVMWSSCGPRGGGDQQ